ncbi:hypothetical protein GCM10007084_33210 [Parabacteroides faecis]|nr:hypothetical protein GCM10007084_33210 [Parabacteroides faecis]
MEVSNIQYLVDKIHRAKISFLKLITANDVGATGAHQAGFHLPKNSWKLFFDSPGIKGYNKDKYVIINWGNGLNTQSRAIYYGKGTRNEYRLTRFGQNFPFLKENNIDDVLGIIRNFDDTYEGFIIYKESVQDFFKESGFTKDNFNTIIINSDKNIEVLKDAHGELQPDKSEQLVLFPVTKDNDKDEIREKTFRPKAHILSLLGDELIKSPVMAIYELVKNAYDADAMKVDVNFNNIDKEGTAFISVEDDGIGMTSDIIENVWLEPGSDFRKPVDKLSNARIIVKSPIYRRVPMGEKGIGRFAVHKLGSEITLITRPLLIKKDNEGNIISTLLADYEIKLSIDWNEFNQSRHLSDVPVVWKIRKDPRVFKFKDRSGTYIELKNLKDIWTKGMAKELKGYTISMLSPRLEKNSFKINLSFDNQWLYDSPSIEDLLEEAPYKILISVDKYFNMELDYKFSLKNTSKIGEREIKDDERYNINIKSALRPYLRSSYEKQGFDDIEVEEKLLSFDKEVQTLPFGNLIFEFYSYDLDSASLRDYSSDNKLTKTVLREHSGIKVYKGDMRVFDYGEKGNDWLGIDLERIQNKEWFSNNQNIGYVYLNPEQSVSLVEKTNREGFIHNKAYDLFFIVLRYLLTEFKNIRLSDRRRWLNFNRGVTEKNFAARINNFKELVENSEIDTAEKKEKLIIEAKKLEEKYEEDTKILMIPAGVGMTASVALHEIEKLVPRMEETIQYEFLDKDIIVNQVAELRVYTEGIISVLRKGGSEKTDINKAIQRAVDNYKRKLKDRRITNILDLDENIENLKVEKRFFVTIMMNLIDNSIYWLDTVNREEPSIFIKSFLDNNVPVVIVADNGPGFKDDISDIITPFFSRKNDGIGIGLYLVDTIMMKYGKFDIVTEVEAEDYGIPKEYGGAVVKLTFNKI